MHYGAFAQFFMSSIRLIMHEAIIIIHDNVCNIHTVQYTVYIVLIAPLLTVYVSPQENFVRKVVIQNT